VAEDENDPTSAPRGTDLERPFPTSESPAVPLRSGTVLAGRYEIGRTIGQGGMGLVVQAFDRTLGVEVAIKIVRAEYAGEREWSERLAREVKLARQIQHPNVCRVFDYAQADGRAFLIMELAIGGTLRDELHAGTTAARLLAARIADARAIAAGLGAIHAAGIVHRDISPQNALRMSDGRLVVSDFGLATDSFDGTTSIRGGTVAYMAPEVAHGGRASFSADIWALGAVIHETVFGQRLQWDPESGEMRSSVARKWLTRTERGVLEICRACLAPNPARRPRDAGEIAARLSEAGLARSASRWRLRRAATVTTAAFLAAAVVVGARRVEIARKRAAQAATAPVDPLMIVLSGQPDDWTDKSKVLAELPDRIRCMVQLPDHRTVRFVWGYPAHAEDVDIRTGNRIASPLVSVAYAEGCPDLSRDARRLVYTGHTADDRAYAFVSTHPDGRDAVPEVPIAEPSMTSDPIWLPEGGSFIYDVDYRNVAVFSTTTKRSLVLPITDSPTVSSSHDVIGNRGFVSSSLQAGTTDISGFELSQLNEVVHFRLSSPVVDLQSPGGDAYYCSADHEGWLDIVAVEPLKNRARLVGTIRGQSLRHPLFVDGDMVFVSSKRTISLVVRSRNDEVTKVPVADDVFWASACGERIAAIKSRSARTQTVWMDATGKTIGSVESIRPGDSAVSLLCSQDGQTMFYSAFGENQQVWRCDGAGCRVIVKGEVSGLALSSDDKRLAFVAAGNRGPLISWISADGSGPTHEVAESDTYCRPLWSNEKDIWVSLRRGARVVWTEIDTNSNRSTGRTLPGTRDCSEGYADPTTPVREPVTVETTFRAQLRRLPANVFRHGSDLDTLLLPR
jgi:hypothetical protein